MATPLPPLWEEMPDGEPRVFEDTGNPGKMRGYHYGSHETRRIWHSGDDQAAWSASVEDDGRSYSYGGFNRSFAADLDPKAIAESRPARLKWRPARRLAVLDKRCQD